MPPDIEALAQDMARLGLGPLAKLRRMDTEGPGPADFWRLSIAHGLPDDATSLVVVRYLALLTPKGALGNKRLHDRATPLGAALGQTGYPEARMLRFLALSRAQRASQLGPMVLWLAAKGHSGIDCRDIDALLRNDGVGPARRLARTYFENLPRKTEDAR